MPLSSAVTVTVGAAATSDLDLEKRRSDLNRSLAVSYASGVLAGQADVLWSDERTLAASATEDLDLNGTALQNAFGANVALARVKAIIVEADAANTNNVVVGGAAANGFVSWVGAAAHTVTVRPGGALALFVGAGDLTGYAVAAATADLLRVGNGGAGSVVKYRITLIGCSA